MVISADLTAWYVGVSLGFVVVLVAVIIVLTVIYWASRIAGQAKTARDAVEAVQSQSTQLHDVPQILDSGVRILHAARALRKVAVGR